MQYKKTLLIGILFLILSSAVIIQTAFAISLDSIQATNSLKSAVNPDLVWNGSNYGLVWSDGRKIDENQKIRFTRLNSLGARVSNEIEVSENLEQISDYSAAIWAGNLYGLVWVDYNNDDSQCGLYFSRVDKDGKEYGGIVKIASGSGENCPKNPSVVWDGLNRYGISWQSDGKIFFVLINDSGEKISDDIQVSKLSGSEKPSLIWNGEEYAIIWQVNQSLVHFKRLNIKGLPLGENIKINNSATSTNPDFAWNGSCYGAVWEGYDSNDQQQLYFAKLDREGYQLAEEIILTTNEEGEYSADPSIVWGNSEFSVAWKQGSRAVNFTGINADDMEKREIIEIFRTNGQIFSPVIAAGKYDYAFVWQEDKEIFFSRIAFADTETLLASISNSGGKADSGAWLSVLIAIAALVIVNQLNILLRKE